MSASNVISPVGEKLYIVGNSNSRINIYNKNLDYIKSVKYPWERVGGPFQLMDNGHYFIGTQSNLVGKNFIVTFKLVSFPSMNEKVIFEKSMIHPYFNKGIFLIDKKPHFSYFGKDNNIYILYMNDYQLFKYNVNGDRLKDVIVKVNKIKNQEANKKLFLEEHAKTKVGAYKLTFSDTVIPVSSLISLGKGFVVVRRKSYSTECTGIAEGDYFNYRIEFVGKVKIPCFYRIYSLLGTKFIVSYQYDNGFLYLAHEKDEELWLEKWQVEE